MKVMNVCLWCMDVRLLRMHVWSACTHVMCVSRQDMYVDLVMYGCMLCMYVCVYDMLYYVIYA